MRNYGYIRVAACSPIVRVADVAYNLEQTANITKLLERENVSVALFPELGVTGYTCADLFGQSALLDQTKTGIEMLAAGFKDSNLSIIVGAPLSYNSRLYNCAVWIYGGRIAGVVPKTHIPNYGEFYEKRWFAPAEASLLTMSFKDAATDEEYNVPFGTNVLFEIGDAKFGIEICEDLWVPNPPSGSLSINGADIILNLSATNELIGKNNYLLNLISNQSARCRCGYVYASAGFGESSTDLLYSGNCIITENGRILKKSDRFSLKNKYEISDIDVESLRHDRIHYNTFPGNEEAKPLLEISCNNERFLGKKNRNPSYQSLLKYRDIDSHPFIDKNPAKLRERCAEISSIQAMGLATRLNAIKCSKAIVGISGGLDSTLALLVTVKAFDMLGIDRKGIIGITMPGFGTTHRTHNNASALIQELGVTEKEISIAKAVEQHFKDIDQNPENHDITYENSQARERTQILMDMANKENGIVIGTGDLSELALGWCTYNGDQMSMYGVNASIPKTLVKYLVRGYAENTDNDKLRSVLEDIINTPISPELLPADSNGEIQQKTEDNVGPYELHDYFIFNALRYGMDPRKVYLTARKAFEGKYDRATIAKWLRTFYHRFFNQQFKRSCMPDGVKVGSICLSPRGDWRMPSDASSALWLSYLEEI